jgi:hypothetical protein
MRNLVLLFVVIALFFLLKTVKKSEKLVILTIEKSQLIDFSGSVFLPANIPVREGDVNAKELELSIAGKNYRYAQKLNEFYLEGTAEELEIEKGDEIRITGTDSVKLFFVRKM